MKKNYIKVQKVVFIVFLVAAALYSILSFGMVQYGWRNLQPSGSINFYTSQTLLNEHSEVFKSAKEATDFYNGLWNQIQNTNNIVFWTGIISLILITVAAIFGNFSRRRFYVSNVVTAVIAALGAVIMSIWSLISVGGLMANFAKARPDFEYYHGLNESNPTINGNNLPMYIVFAIVLILAGACFCSFAVFKFIKTWPKFEKKGEQLEGEVVSNE